MSEQAASKETTMALTELYDKAYRSGLRDGQERMRERCAKECEYPEPECCNRPERDRVTGEVVGCCGCPDPRPRDYEECAAAIRALPVEE